MKKNPLKFFTLLFSFMLMVSCAEKPVGEACELPLGTHFVVDGIHYETTGDKTVKVTHPFTKEEKQYSGEVAVPSSIEYESVKYDVRQIGEYALSGCADLKSVSVADGVTEISVGAFADCPLLDDITLPKSVERVSERVFDGTAWYDKQPEGLVYKDDVLYQYKGVVPDNAEILVKEGTRVIAGCAFSEQNGLASVKIPDGVVSIGNSAFGWCSNLVKVDIPNSVKEIGPSAFSSCVALENVKLPDELTMIGAMAFSGCENLKSIEFPSKLDEIGMSSFAECKGLKTLTIPSNMKIIRSDAFWGCKSLESVNIEEGVSKIENEAFMECTNLKEVNVPQSLKMMGGRVLENTAWLENQPEGLIRLANIIYMFKGKMPDFTDLVLDEGVKGVAGRAFYGCEGLHSIKFPKTLAAIGDEAFYNCKSMSSVDIPESLEEVAFAAFWGCSSLTRVNISDLKAWCNIYFCGKEANPLHEAGNIYLNGELVTDLVIPEGVTKVGDYSFVYGLCLNSVTIPEHVKQIGFSAFEESRALDSLAISEGVEVIRDNAFKNCMNISKVIIPSTVRNIGFGTFEKCYKLNNLTINEGIKEIPNMAFEACSNLKSVTIPSTVTKLGHKAFGNCLGMREVVCRSMTPPKAMDAFLFETDADFIYGVTTLNVPKDAVELYKKSADWNKFMSIKEIKD